MVVAIPWTITADLARAVIGPDDPAVAVRGVVIGRRVVDLPVEEVMPVEVLPVAIAPRVNPVEAAITAVENRRGVIAAAVETAAMEGCSTAVKTAASMETSTTMKAASAAVEPSTAAAMSNFGRQTAGC